MGLPTRTDRILVIAPSWVGDVVMATPAIRETGFDDYVAHESAAKGDKPDALDAAFRRFEGVR